MLIISFLETSFILFYFGAEVRSLRLLYLVIRIIILSKKVKPYMA